MPISQFNPYDDGDAHDDDDVTPSLYNQTTTPVHDDDRLINNVHTRS